MAVHVEHRHQPLHPEHRPVSVHSEQRHLQPDHRHTPAQLAPLPAFDHFAGADHYIGHQAPLASISVPHSVDWAQWPEGQLPCSATMGYEQLLSIQQNQHQLELEHKDAEARHLKACLEALSLSNSSHPNRGAEEFAEALQSQEEAATLLMAAKNKELELMVGLLQQREQQIEDFRQLCEAQRLEMQQLKRRRHSTDFAGPGESLGSSVETVRTPEGTTLAEGDIASQRFDGAFSSSNLHSSGRVDKEERRQLQREVRRLRLRMEELEAAMGEQHDRSSGLARELEVKDARVKALEEQVRVLHSPAGNWPGPVSPHGSDICPALAPGDEMSPGFGIGLDIAVGSGQPMLHHYQERRHHELEPNVVDDSDRARTFGPLVHEHRSHQHHGHLDQHRRMQHHRSVLLPGRNIPHTNGALSGDEHAPATSSPSLALPSLQPGHALPSRSLGDDPALPRRPAAHGSALGANGDAGAEAEAQAAEAAAAYLLAKSTERRPAKEPEAVDVRRAARPSSPRQPSPRALSPAVEPCPHHHSASNHVHKAGTGQHQQAPPSATKSGSTHVHASPGAAASTLDAMALRRLGDENLRPTSAPGPSNMLVSEIDLTQSHLSLTGESQVQSYHSAMRLDQVEADLQAVEATPGRSESGVLFWHAPSHAAETSRQSQELLKEMRRLRLQMSELERVAGRRQGPNAVTVGHRSRTNGGKHRRGNDHLGASASSLDSDGGLFHGELQGSGGERGSSSSPVRSRAVNAATATASGKKPEGVSWQWPRSTGEDGGNHRNGALTPVSGSGASSAAVRSERSEQHNGPEFAGWEYRPHVSGDPVDAAVASLVNRPGRYRGWRALLCRLEQGIYLCGTRRVHLRADLAQERIEASDDGGTTWSDLEVLMRGAEASQRALLERARDAAGLAA